MDTLSLLPTVLCAPLVFGAAGVALFGRRATYAIPGLLFHSVAMQNRLVLSSLSASHFAAIINHLHRKRLTPVTLGEAAGKSLTSGVRPLSNPIFLTFDDGCRSFYIHALPLLETLRFKVTVFPVAGYLGMSSSWDVMPSFPHLTKSQIAEISALGHEIGSHGCTHSNLAYLDMVDCIQELRDSKKILEDITGKPVTSISFPYGDWNMRVWEYAQNLGYTHGAICRGHRHHVPGLWPVNGVYGFDTPENIIARITPKYPFSLSVARGKIMSHFAKGAPIWKFRKNYRLFR
jgi:peptidoglycan/xylan/chitin deacetylase (PgdA/CDA1 family)